MVIRTSSGNQVAGLIADLASDSLVSREAAVARLAVIGARAVERLIAAIADRSTPRPARIAGFRTLEAIADARAIEPALQALDDPDPDVAIAAIAAARTFIEGPHSVQIVDRLTVLTLDKSRTEAVVRLAAFRALEHLEISTLQPLRRALQDEAGSALATAAKASPGGFDSDDWLRTADGPLPDDPQRVSRALADDSSDLSLAFLHRLIERIREREQSEQGRRRTEWMMARAAAHLGLARRRSRLAVYDLRETFDTAQDPLPVEFLTAVGSIGDASCLKALAGAYARSREPQRSSDDWWPRHIGDAFRAIAAREKMTRRSPEIKKIDRQWPGLVNELWAGREGKARRAGR